MSRESVALGERIRDARKRLGLTQRQLADQVGLPAHQVVSQIEQGKREIKAWELARIAQILRLTVAELLSPEPLAIPTVVWRDAPGDGARSVEARFLAHCREYHFLERVLGLPPATPLPSFRLYSASLTLRQADALAEEVRTTLGLGPRPAVSLAAVLERKYRVKVWYEPLGETGSAAAVKGNFGYGIVINADHAPWRRNYSLAHELFHLVTWEGLAMEAPEQERRQWSSQVEKAAQAFAAALLLPAEAISSEFEARVEDGKIAYADLVQLARDFDVSTEALLWRLVRLGRMREDETQRILADLAFRDLDRRSMPERWWKPLVPPERFALLAFLAYQRGKISRARLAELLMTSLVDLKTTLTRYGLPETQDRQATAVVA